jgi:hypothetical protein
MHGGEASGDLVGDLPVRAAVSISAAPLSSMSMASCLKRSALAGYPEPRGI